ncbi:2901_t:CDS:2, partial [Entrophospora sp. SA101]
MGSDTVRYDQTLTLVHEENSVLYLRDVINTDKQDDGAAYRFFHSDFLKQCQSELFDGYLNRTICHKTRIIMVMRAYFFLNVWKEYLNNCANIYSQKWYSFNKSCISIQSWKTFGSLAEYMVLLVLAHRNYYSNCPFLPWEHDITKITHCDKILRQENLTQTSEKSSAEGYIFDIDGSTLSNNDIEILCQWPMDNEIDDAVRIAYENAAAVETMRLCKLNDFSVDNNNDESVNDSNNLVHSMEIQYILNNEPSTDTYFVLEKEPEEDSFTNGSSIVAKILNIRKSHEAYSHSKHLHKVSNIMRLDNAHENINTNTANQLITQITSNDSGQTVRRRVTRWQGRKNIENMFRTNDNMPGFNIGCANISEINPLDRNGYLLIFTENQLCIAKIIVMYELKGGKHALVDN